MRRVAKTVYFKQPADESLLAWLETVVETEGVSVSSFILKLVYAEKNRRESGEADPNQGLGRINIKLNRISDVVEELLRQPRIISATVTPAPTYLPEEEVFNKPVVDISGLAPASWD